MFQPPLRSQNGSNIQQILRCLMGDLLPFCFRQLQIQEPLDLLHRVPQREVAAEYHPLRAIAVNVGFRDPLGHKHDGAGNVEETVGILQVLISGLVHGVAAEMGSHHLQLREQLQHMPQPLGVGKVVPGIAHVEDHRQFPLDHLVNREQLGIVNDEELKIRVDLQSPQSQIHDPLNFVGDALHGGVEGAEADEFRVSRCLLCHKVVDMTGLAGLHSHGQGDELVNSRLLAQGQQLLGSAVQLHVLDLVKIPDALGCLVGNGIWVNMSVKINDSQENRLECICIGMAIQPVFIIHGRDGKSIDGWLEN